MIKSIKMKILLWNANGIQKHKKEQKLLLSTENIDVCLISKTHLTKESFFKIPLFEHTIQHIR